MFIFAEIWLVLLIKKFLICKFTKNSPYGKNLFERDRLEGRPRCFRSTILSERS